MKQPRSAFVISSLLGVSVALAAASLLAGEAAPHPKPVVKTQGFLPFADEPIHYRTSKTLTDQITLLNQRLERGEVTLTWEPKNGYLRSVLEALRVPPSSQMLVYSKTSLQLQQISPGNPRALYFNDNVYVGQVPHARSLELIAFDAQQGAVFYVMGEEKVDQPRFERAQLDCVQCHIAAATRGIPGVIVRSMLTTSTGSPKGGAPVYTMGHETPFSQRWAGWYLTGNTSAIPHQGNLNTAVPVTDAANLSSLARWLDTTKYLQPHSDVVAHLVLAHQTQMHNYVTELNYRYRLGVHADQLKAKRDGVDYTGPSAETRQRYEQVAEATLRYLLFANEVRLPGPVQGSSTFTNDFAALGPRDRKGRSLREFDLQQRVFKYPCSYLIYSDAFDAIPGPAKEYLLRRLFDVLSGRDQSADFAGISAETRRAILEILVDTKSGLPESWGRYLRDGEHEAPGLLPTTARAQR